MNAIVGEEAEARRFQTAPSHDILYVEDDAALRNVFAHLLFNSGYRVEVAEDGEAGWEALRLGSYDLLITDNDMPRLTGLELVKRLRSAGQTLPVVMTSGSFRTDEADHYDWLRVAATLEKPFTAEQLLITVKAVLRGRGGCSEVRPTVPPVLAEAVAPIQPASHWGINA
jgi:DNA-binding response OmpR family regulator